MDVVKNASTTSEIKDLLRKAIISVNSLVYKMSKAQPELRGMGTTLCCLLFHPTGLILAHVGDSRIYRFRENKLEQLTKDHSLLRELVEQGQLNEQQATDFLYKNIITKAIGTESRIDPSVDEKDIQDNDVYLMCSDGLSDLLTAMEIETILAKGSSLKTKAELLVESANNKGGRDNITVVIAKVKEINDIKDLS